LKKTLGKGFGFRSGIIAVAVGFGSLVAPIGSSATDVASKSLNRGAAVRKKKPFPKPTKVTTSPNTKVTSAPTAKATTESTKGSNSSTTSASVSKKQRVLTSFEEFELALYRNLNATAGETKNFVLSPYSVTEAFSMIRAGASGATAKQLDTALAGLSTINASTRQRLREEILKELVRESGTYVHIANSLWTLPAYQLRSEFDKIVRNSYAAKVAGLEFATNPKGSADTINAWVSEITEKQIPSLVSAEQFNESTRAVIVNAILFHGKWIRKFDKTQTTPEKFTVNGAAVNVPTMHSKATVYVQKDAIVVDLPYTGLYKMRIAVPTKSNVANLDQATDELFKDPLTEPSGLDCPNVSVSVPSWKSTSNHELVAPMKKLGVTDLFDVSASNLSGVSPAAEKEGLFVSGAIQQATITVDEEGTVAAAGTAIFAEAASAPIIPPNCPPVAKVDRPFVYVIQNTTTGQILFAGRIMNPLEK
jgi:serpin B